DRGVARPGSEPLVLRRRAHRLEPVADDAEPDLVGVEHRAAVPDRPAVAVDPDHVDVAGPCRDALFEDARTLVDHRENQPLDDLRFVDRPARDAVPGRRFGNELLDFGVGPRRARSGLVAVESLAGPLPEPPGR